jgi:hypothetical protein
MERHAAPPGSAARTSGERRRRVRLSVLLLSLMAAGFYFGFIVLSIVRAAR